MGCRPYDNPMPGSTISPSQELWIWLQIYSFWGAISIFSDQCVPKTEVQTFHPLDDLSPYDSSLTGGWPDVWWATVGRDCEGMAFLCAPCVRLCERSLGFPIGGLQGTRGIAVVLITQCLYAARVGTHRSEGHRPRDASSKGRNVQTLFRGHICLVHNTSSWYRSRTS